jgi:hypothetical protein
MFPSIPCSTWKSDVWNVSAFPCLILSKLYKQPLHTWWLGECFWLWTWYVVQSAKLTLGDVSPHLPYLAIFAASCWPKVATSCSSFKPHLGQVYVSLCVTVCVCAYIATLQPLTNHPNPTQHHTCFSILGSAWLKPGWVPSNDAQENPIFECPKIGW